MAFRMLIHGRLILTAHSLMLDEVRSLLQKSLRRKERDLALQATRELLAYGKDQLPWKSLVTFLFEDHCLSNVDVVEALGSCYRNEDKYSAVELLLQAWTCRVAACVPVVTLDPGYDPKNWDVDVEIPAEYQGLLTVSAGQINCARLIVNLVKAWREKRRTELMSYVKLATMVEDVMQSTVTKKGEGMLLGKVKKPRPTHVFLSVLHKATEDAYMKRYIRACFKLAGVLDVCLRLVLCSVLTQVLFRDRVRPIEGGIKCREIQWNEVERLTKMPHWAVDKHTFRGKYGKGTKHLMKGCPKELTEAQYEEFHGERPKSDIREFFTEGCKCERQTMDDNPYWERTKEIYFSKPHRLQKTAHMTKVYYAELLKKYPQIKVKAKTGSGGKTEKEMKVQSKKRPSSDVDPEAKRQRTQDTESDHDDSSPPEAKSSSEKTSEKAKSSKQDTTAKMSGKTGKPTKKDSAKTVDYESLNLPGPLLQLPTGGGKLYTCADLEIEKVIKGPYPKHKLAMTRFFHEAMTSLGDPHTLPMEIDGAFIKFELLKGEGVDVKITVKDFYDAISKQNIRNGQFLTRESLGIVQLHRMEIKTLHNVPMSFWAHYVYRACLNIGDSGLYNAITDSKLGFLYGIDMEEQRKAVNSGSLLELMFVKKPAKAYCTAIMTALTANKQDIMRIIQQDVDYEKLVELANNCGYENFNAQLFKQRLTSAQNLIKKL